MFAFFKIWIKYRTKCYDYHNFLFIFLVFETWSNFYFTFLLLIFFIDTSLTSFHRDWLLCLCVYYYKIKTIKSVERSLYASSFASFCLARFRKMRLHYWQDAAKNAVYEARSRSNHALGRFFKWDRVHERLLWVISSEMSIVKDVYKCLLVIRKTRRQLQRVDDDEAASRMTFRARASVFKSAIKRLCNCN